MHELIDDYILQIGKAECRRSSLLFLPSHFGQKRYSNVISSSKIDTLHSKLLKHYLRQKKKNLYITLKFGGQGSISSFWLMKSMKDATPRRTNSAN